MLRQIIRRLLGQTGRATGGIWDHRPLLRAMPPPPQVGRETHSAHLRVIDGTLAQPRTHLRPTAAVRLNESCMRIKPNPDMVASVSHLARRP
jgi:hypothetical protein